MTETAMAATQHIPLQPKSDLALFYGLANILIAEGWIDQNYIDAHTTDYDDFRQFVAPFTPDRVAAESGISKEKLHYLARTIHKGKRVSFWWTMGVNQSYQGVRTAQSLINLALMTGNMGRPGTGANSITGQCNAMGSRLFSNTTNLLGGHDFENAADRQKVASLLNLDVDRIPQKNSWPYDKIIEGILRGKSKPLGHLHQPCPLLDQPKHQPRNPRPPRFPRRSRYVPHDRNRPTRRPRPPRRRLGRKRRHLHQLRTPPRPHQKSRPRTGQGPLRFLHFPTHRPPLGLRRPLRRLANARRRFSHP